jgi:hypothetical protein
MEVLLTVALDLCDVQVLGSGSFTLGDRGRATH